MTKHLDTHPPLDRAKLADAILATALDCIIVADDQGRIVEFNQAAEQTFGFSRAEVLGRPMEESIVPHHHRHAHQTGMVRYLTGGAARVIGRRVEVEGLHASGRVFPVELSITETVMDGSRYFVATLRDITDQRKTADALLQARVSLQSFFDNVPAELYLREIDGAILMANRYSVAFSGLDQGSIEGQDIFAFDRPGDAEVARLAQEELLATGQPVTREFHPLVNGREVVILNTIFPIRDDAGTIVRIGGFSMEVTELHNARIELERTKTTLQSFINQAPVGIYVNRIGPGGVQDQIVEFSNDMVCQPYGLTAADFIGKNPFDVVRDKDFLSLALASDALILSSKEPQHAERPNPYSGKFESYTRFPILDQTGRVTHIAGMRVDIDDRVRAQSQAEEYRLLLASIFDNIPTVLYLRELDGTIVMMNRFGAKVLGGAEGADLIGQRAGDLNSPEEGEQATAAQARVLDTGLPVTQEYTRTLGGREMVVLNTIFPIRDTSGTIMRIGGFASDVTELYVARDQLARAQDSLYQSEKLAALGQLLAGVAHELNNPLAVVLGRAAILQEKLADTPHAKPLQKLREAADRCARIVRTFLAMARQTGPRRQVVSVTDLIESALEMTTYGLRSADITWTAAPPDRATMIEVDEDQIVQVLINLILNAQHALAGQSDPRKITLASHLSDDGAWLRIEVADTGPGVPAAHAGRIFDPFFTTKPVGQGTGLGLSVCKGMIEAHGGRLELLNPGGPGATFRISLPAQVTCAAPDASPAAGTMPTRRGRILVVDDEVEIAAILADCLTPLGIDCEIATDGLSALQRLTTMRFDAVFCDISMPGMDGIAFYERLLALDPDLARHLVFVSGDILHRNLSRARQIADRPVIEKPFDPQMVRATALQLLDRQGGAP